jgi:hypothetical protein
MTIEIGKIMEWHKIVSNYGHISILRVIVRKIGKRITVEAPLKNGGTRLAIVQPHRLHELGADR